MPAMYFLANQKNIHFFQVFQSSEENLNAQIPSNFPRSNPAVAPFHRYDIYTHYDDIVYLDVAVDDQIGKNIDPFLESCLTFFNQVNAC